MNIQPSDRLEKIGTYAFAEVDNLVAKLKSEGVSPVDFGVGDPTLPTPKIIRNACKAGVDKHASAGYPSYIGMPEYRKEVSGWFSRRFGVTLDPNTEICATIGSKEAVFNLHEGFVNPGEYVLIPTPGYPPYSRGTLFAEGVPYYYPLTKENGFLPDLAAIPDEVVKKSRMIWICYPNNPTSRVAPASFLKEMYEWGQKHDILICSDEAYTEQYYTDEPPHSMLEFGKDGVLVVHSLSKRSAMTGYRIGFVAGDKRAVDIFKKVKTNVDSGTPGFVQEGAIAAYADETHVKAMRDEYKTKRDLLVKAFVDIGLPDCSPEGTMYLWQEVPRGMTSAEFAKRLLDPEIAVVATPGSWVSDVAADGTNPGEGFVRFALVPSVEETKRSADRIRENGTKLLAKENSAS